MRGPRRAHTRTTFVVQRSNPQGQKLSEKLLLDLLPLPTPPQSAPQLQQRQEERERGSGRQTWSKEDGQSHGSNVKHLGEPFLGKGGRQPKATADFLRNSSLQKLNSGAVLFGY